MGVLSSVAEWIAKGYPRSVAERIVSGELPMDEASRLVRAREQGYGDTLYVGHSSHMPIESGTDLTLYSDKDVARRTADRDIESEEMGLFDHLADEDDYFFDAPESPGVATVTPVRHNADKLLTHNAGGKSLYDVRETDFDYDELHHYPGTGYVKFGDMISEAVKRKQDPDNRLLPQYETVPPRQGVLYQDLKNYGGDIHNQTDLFGLNKQNSTIPGADVRHINAAFDPQYKGSNIMGGALAGAVGLGALGQSEDADASIAALARRGLKVIKNGDDYDLIDEAAGDYAGKMTTEELLNGNLWSLDTQLNDAYRGQGIGNEYYDAVEEASGKKMQPSPWLSADGVRFWGRRDPEALADMVRNDKFYDGENYEQALGHLQEIEHPGFVDEAPSQVKLRGFRDVFSAAPALAAPALMKDGVFQHGATSEPVVERREPVRNQSGLLADVTEFGDEVFKSVRHAAGPLADVFMPYEGVNNYLKTVNDYDRQPTWWDRLGILDL